MHLYGTLFDDLNVDVLFLGQRGLRLIPIHSLQYLRMTYRIENTILSGTHLIPMIQYTGISLSLMLGLASSTLVTWFVSQWERIYVAWAKKKSPRRGWGEGFLNLHEKTRIIEFFYVLFLVRVSGNISGTTKMSYMIDVFKRFQFLPALQ